MHSNGLVLAASMAGLALAAPSNVFQKRQSACAAEPTGAGALTTPDTAAAFSANSVYSTTASDAETPQGYQLSFQDYDGAQTGAGYVTYYTLDSYDTIQCQQYCDSNSAVCTGFDVYFERDPSVDPGSACPDPASTTNIVCALWNADVCEASATNTGQYRDEFQVVIAGSNGYNKNPVPCTVDGFSGPFELGGAIESSSYLTYQSFTGAFDPTPCGPACEAIDGCVYFNAYVQSVNNVAQGTFCGFYSQVSDKSYSTNYGQYQGSNYVSISSSYGYSLEILAQ